MPALCLSTIHETGPPTPLRKVGLQPPWALDPIWDGALGPMGPGPRLDLELFGPRMGFWEIEKQKGAHWAQDGPIWAETWSK